MIFIISLETLSQVLLIFQGYLSITVACIGVVINILGIISLARCRTRTMFILLLSSVLIFDTIYLFCSLINSIISRFVSLPVIILRLCSVLVYPGLRFSLISSITLGMFEAVPYMFMTTLNFWKPFQLCIFIS